MLKLNSKIDFHLSCNCFLQVQKGLNAQGIKVLGLIMWSDKGGNSGLAVPIIKRLVNPNGSQQRGMIHLDFCPFCGKQIATILARSVKDEKDTKPKSPA